jgi:hypothetical protein
VDSTSSRCRSRLKGLDLSIVLTAPFLSWAVCSVTIPENTLGLGEQCHGENFLSKRCPSSFPLMIGIYKGSYSATNLSLIPEAEPLQLSPPTVVPCVSPASPAWYEFQPKGKYGVNIIYIQPVTIDVG